jgi:uncharacterized protein (TIGR03382 family)
MVFSNGVMFAAVLIAAGFWLLRRRKPR